MFQRLRRLVILTLLLPGLLRADLREQLDELFNGMVNINQPTAYQGQRRGVLTGGSLYARVRLMAPNLVNLTPPAFRGGCGGIDLFAGSFSYISKDEFIQLLRAVAANAPGYAFELAMQSFCPTCAQEMQRLQKVVQELNQMLGNSCQLAQGLVTDVMTAVTGKQQQQSGLIATLSGAAEDFLAGLRPQDGDSPSRKAREAAPQQVQQQIMGNVVWRALKTRNAGAWFRFGDDALLEAIMSVTGTLIVGDIPPGGQEHRVTPVEPTLTLHDILAGSGPGQWLRVLNCGSDNGPDGCLEPGIQEIEFKGLAARVQEVLLGNGGNNPGVVAKIRWNLGAPTELEKGFMEVAPGAVVAMLRNLALRDQGMATLLAREAAPVLALEMAYGLIEEMIGAVRSAASLNSHHLGPDMQRKLEEVRSRLIDKRVALHEQKSRLADLIAYYTGIRDTLQAGAYARWSEGGK